MPSRRDDGARPFVPQDADLPALRRAASICRGCDLYKDATQVVFGAGSESPAIVLVGEQPGDKEDLQGEPFVGPAGLLLDRALETAGVPRDRVYLTNAVKHFKFQRRGKRRIHEKPRISEVYACGPWLEAELQRLTPRVIVALGATAATALLGPSARVTRDRGAPHSSRYGDVVVTLHPSAALRARTPEERQALADTLAADLALAWRLGSKA